MEKYSPPSSNIMPDPESGVTYKGPSTPSIKKHLAVHV